MAPEDADDHTPTLRFHPRGCRRDAGRRPTAPPTDAGSSHPRPSLQKLHAEAWLADRKREIDTQLWNPPRDKTPLTHRLRRLCGPLAGVEAVLVGRDPIAAADEEPLRATSWVRRFLLPAFGDQRRRADDPSKDIRDWYAKTLVDKPTMRAHSFGLLKSILATAVADELIDANPCRIRGAGQTTRAQKDQAGDPRRVGRTDRGDARQVEAHGAATTFCALRFSGN